MPYIKLRGINYFFEDLNADQKNAILLVHGHPFDHFMWRDQVDSLKNFRLILPDLRGYGKTDYDFDKIYIEEHALDLAFLLDRLEIDKVHLVGLSMGGQIIVEFARLFPHRCQSLIICDSNPSGENENSYQERLDLVERMRGIGMEKYAQQDIYKYLHPVTVQEKGEAYRHLFKMMADTNLKGAVASHRGRAERRDNFSYLHKIKIPTLIIGGDKDFFTPVDDLKKIAQEITNAGLIVIQNAGHIPNMEQPEQFNKAILGFLENDVMKTKGENVEIRIAIPEDGLAISTLLYEAFKEYKPLYTEKAFAATILGISKIEERIHSKAIWVAVYNNVISGTISMMPNGDGLYVKSVAVAPAARNKGLGKALMKHAEKEGLRMGFHHLELTTTSFLFEAIRLYERFGFEQCGHEDLYGTSLIKMKKNLKPEVALINKNNIALAPSILF